MPGSKLITLTFKNLKIRSNELLEFDFNGLSDYEKKVLSLARDWVSQKEHFEFQTSGSTGAPRKVVFHRSQIKESARLTKDTFRLVEGYEGLLCLDPDFVAGKMMIIRALEIGMNLHCIPPIANPVETLDAAIDFAALVPFQLESILNSTSSDKINQIKTAILGGSPVSENLTRRIQSTTTRFYETYGMTETLTHVAVRKLNPPQNEFHVLPGIRINTDENQCLSITAAHLSTEVIQTNDLVEITSESTFRITGRLDNIINTGGVKISPESLEIRIAPILENALPGHHYFVAGLTDQSFGERVVLYVESKDLPPDVKNQILGECKSKLLKWEVPKEIIAVPEFSRTNSGKINRQATLQK